MRVKTRGVGEWTTIEVLCLRAGELGRALAAFQRFGLVPERIFGEGAARLVAAVPAENVGRLVETLERTMSSLAESLGYLIAQRGARMPTTEGLGRAADELVAAGLAEWRDGFVTLTARGVEKFGMG